MLIDKGNLHQKKLATEKITFPPKHNGHTYGWADISNYKVASLLTTKKNIIQTYNRYLSTYIPNCLRLFI